MVTYCSALEGILNQVHTKMEQNKDVYTGRWVKMRINFLKIRIPDYRTQITAQSKLIKEKLVNSEDYE